MMVPADLDLSCHCMKTCAHLQVAFVCPVACRRDAALWGQLL